MFSNPSTVDKWLEERQVHLFLDQAKGGDWNSVEAWSWSDPANASHVNDMPKGRWSAIHQAAWWGAEDAAMMLIRFGADATLKNRDNQTPSEVAKSSGFHDLATMLANIASCQHVLPNITSGEAEDVTNASCADVQTALFSRVSSKRASLELCKKDGLAYKQLARKFKADEDVARAAFSSCGAVLEFAPTKIQNNKDLVLVACSQDGIALRHASPKLQNDHEVVVIACSQNGSALQLASKELQNNKAFVRSAIIASWGGKESAYKYASEICRKDKGIAKAAFHNSGILLECAPWEVKDDKECVLVACSQNGMALQYASFTLQDTKEVVLIACSRNGYALKFASPKLKNDMEVALTACSNYGAALEYASDLLRGNKEVVLVAVQSNPETLKFALAGLNQDRDCLIKAGLWDDNYVGRQKTDAAEDDLTQTNKIKIVLSTRFSLTAKSSAHATRFAVELKKHPYISNGNFVVYSPNAFNKGTCDPKWTDKNWPCQGTYSSCQKPPHLKRGVPQESECCWRYSFRYHLEEASASGGFMIQVTDLLDYHTSTKDCKIFDHTLGDGQMIETSMATDVGIKIFRFFEPVNFPNKRPFVYVKEVDKLVHEIKCWYNDGCVDTGEVNFCRVQSPLAQALAARASRRII